MNKKIFLTSMVALMIACPAFGNATLVPDPNDPSTESGYIPDPDISADCGSTPLTYQDQSPSAGTYTLTAQWEPHVCSITLNPNNGSGINQGGDASRPNNQQNKTIWSKYGSGAYKTHDSQTDTVSDLMSSSSNGLGSSSLPYGIEVTIDFNVVMPQGYSGATPTVSGGPLTVQRHFMGYYPNPTSDDMYINAQGFVQQAGTDAAKLIEKTGTPPVCPTTIWYARYDCPVIGAFPSFPDVTGYTPTVNQWSDGTTNVAPGASASGLCLTDTTFSVSYTANKYKIIYQRGMGTTGYDCADANSYEYSNNLEFNQNPNHTVQSLSDVSMSAPSGFEFDYWSVNVIDPNDNSHASGHYDPNDVYGASTPWTTAGNLVFTAHCKPSTFTLTYDCDVGTVKSDLNDLTYTSGAHSGTKQIQYLDMYDFTARTPENTCEDLTGNHTLPTGATWTCVQTGTNTPVNPTWVTQQTGQQPRAWQYAYNVTCKATWDDVITLVWNPDNGQNPDTNTCTWGATTSDSSGYAQVPQLFQTPTKPGHTFKGWLVTDHQ